MKKVLEEENEGESDPIVTHLQEAYKSCSTTKARVSVLMLVPTKFSKRKVCDIFDCNYYEIRQARSICKLYGTLAEPPKQERVYSRSAFH